jgi:hypothetical protein
MVDIETYLEESNAIEDIHTERALADSLDAWNYLRQQSKLTHDTLQTAHEHILKHRQPDIAGQYREIQVQVGGRRPPPPEFVELAMEQLLEWPPANPIEAVEWHIAFERITRSRTETVGSVGSSISGTVGSSWTQNRSSGGRTTVRGTTHCSTRPSTFQN